MNPDTGRPAASRAEILVCGCSSEDLRVLRSASGSEGPLFRTVENPVKLAQQAAEKPPLAVILGVREAAVEDLDMIAVLRALRKNLPVIVVAREDSLALERRAREAGVFYYLVHPIDRQEVEAVFKAVFRHEEGARGSTESM